VLSRAPLLRPFEGHGARGSAAPGAAALARGERHGLAEDHRIVEDQVSLCSL